MLLFGADVFFFRRSSVSRPEIRSGRTSFAFLLYVVALILYGLPVHAGSANLTWKAPTTNVDGTTLTDLAGYKIYYGTSSGAYTSAVDVGNVTSYQVQNLSDGSTYFFAVTDYNANFVESAFSTEVSKAIPLSQGALSGGLTAPSGASGSSGGPIPVGYDPPWLASTIVILTVAGGYLLRRRKKADSER